MTLVVPEDDANDRCDALEPWAPDELVITCDVGAPGTRFHVGVSAIIVEGERLLMARRAPSKEWAPGRWDLPGGHVEEGEGELEALLREAREELDVALEPASLRRVGRLLGPNYDVAYYVVGSWSGSPSNAAPNEHTELAWMSQSELLQADVADPNALPIIRRGFGEKA